MGKVKKSKNGMFAETAAFLAEWWKVWQFHRIDALAAQMAYHLLCALVPGMLFIAMLLSWFGQKPEVLERVLTFLSSSMLPSVYELVEKELLKFVGIPFSFSLAMISLLLMLWSGSHYVSALESCLVPPERRSARPWWFSKLISAMVVLAFPIIVILGLNGILFGKVVSQYVLYHTNLSFNSAELIEVMRPLLTAMFLFAVTWLLYRFAPGARPTGRPAFPGAAVFVLTWLGITSLLRWVVVKVGGFGAVYGTLGVIIMLLSWLYLTSLLLLFGGTLNATLESRAEKRSRTP